MARDALPRLVPGAVRCDCNTPLCCLARCLRTGHTTAIPALPRAISMPEESCTGCLLRCMTQAAKTYPRPSRRLCANAAGKQERDAVRSAKSQVGRGLQPDAMNCWNDCESSREKRGRLRARRTASLLRKGRRCCAARAATAHAAAPGMVMPGPSSTVLPRKACWPAVRMRTATTSPP